MFVLGDEWVVYSCAFLSVQLAFLWTHGIRLFSSEEKFNLKKILLNINIISIAIGAVLMICNLHLPTFVTDISSSLSGMIGNIGMLIAGMTMATVNVKKTVFNKRLYLVLFMRLIAIPAIALMLLKPLSMMIPLANVDKILLVSFLACMTPSAATVLQFAQIHNKDADFAASVNVVSTIASIVTMPIFVALYCM